METVELKLEEIENQLGDKISELEKRIQGIKGRAGLVGNVSWSEGRKRVKGLEVKRHKKLDYKERIKIYCMKSLGYGIREIAKSLDRAPSTISREIRVNRIDQISRGLESVSKAKLADEKAKERRRGGRRGRVRLKCVELRESVEEGLKGKLSPELISGRIKLEEVLPPISHEAIYQWIYECRRDLIEYLVRKGKRYTRSGKKRSRAHKKVVRAPKQSIEERSEVANNRLEVGHYEVDTIVSRKSKHCLLVVQERSLRVFNSIVLTSCCSEEASNGVIKMLRDFKEKRNLPVLSLTLDNGPENQGYQIISEALKIPVYFCHPYTSSERGGIENRNGRLREYYPKGFDFSQVRQEELEEVVSKLNNRPMRCLGFLTPYEVANDCFEPMFEFKLAA